MASITHDRASQKKTEKHFVDLSTAYRVFTRCTIFNLKDSSINLPSRGTRIFSYQKFSTAASFSRLSLILNSKHTSVSLIISRQTIIATVKYS